MSGVAKARPIIVEWGCWLPSHFCFTGKIESERKTRDFKL